MSLNWKRATILIACILLSGCYGPFRKYQPQWAKNIQQSFEQQIRVDEAYKSAELPSYWVGKPLNEVIESWGQPDAFAIGTKGDGTVSYRTGDFHGFTIIVKQGIVAEVVKF